jgi:hypothetical protein
MTATVLTEGLHPGHYLVSEANAGSTGVSRSVDTITVANNVNLEAGSVIMDNGSGEAVFYDASSPAIGILFDNVNTTATGTGAAAPGMVYHARDCEVNAGEIVVDPALTPVQLTTMGTELSALGIIQRA